MIGHLRGVIVAKHPPGLIVDVSGVGYELDAPMSTFYELPELGVEVTLHTHLVVREDSPIKSAEDLRGKTVGVGASDSPQATLIPLAHLAATLTHQRHDADIRRRVADHGAQQRTLADPRRGKHPQPLPTPHAG